MAILSRAGRFILFASFVGFVGCSAPLSVTETYQERHPLQVQGETVAYPVIFGLGRDPTAGEAGRRLDQTIEGYLEGGHGSILLSAASPGRPDAGRQAAELGLVRERLIQRGVPATAIRTATADAVLPADTVTVSYERYSASLPTCGDWSAEPSFNPYNDVLPNFGCSWQRNVGLMVADPADLVHMRGTGTSDAQRMDDVLQKYREGKPTAVQDKPHFSPQQAPNSSSSAVGQGQ
jgi:pilus biogenesis lipoprotein CpaD